MFYCQYLSGIGHLVRSTEIVRSLVKEFQVYFINGGPPIEGFEMPPQVETITLPALWLEDGNFTVADNCNVEDIKEIRKNQLIAAFDRIQPDCLITEFFPFGRHKLLFELLPLVEHIKSTKPETKIVCSLRDVIGKVSDPQEEETICYLMNKYFDLLLFHSDASFQAFAETFFRHQDIKCEITHTGFITQTPKTNYSNVQDLWGKKNPAAAKILVSVGGGRIGYELLEAVVEASVLVEKSINHKIQIFTGPFLPEDKFLKLQQAAINRDNVNISRYTSHFIAYMKTADVSMSLSGYNTTMNILSTGVRAIVVPLGHNNQDKEQLVRTQKLEKLGIVEVLHPENLEPAHVANIFVTSLNKSLVTSQRFFNLKGADNTTAVLQKLLGGKVVVNASC